MFLLAAFSSYEEYMYKACLLPGCLACWLAWLLAGSSWLPLGWLGRWAAGPRLPASPAIISDELC